MTTLRLRNWKCAADPRVQSHCGYTTKLRLHIHHANEGLTPHVGRFRVLTHILKKLSRLTRAPEDAAR